MSYLDSIINSTISAKQEEERRKLEEAEEKKRQEELQKKIQFEEEQKIKELTKYMENCLSVAESKLNSVGALPSNEKLSDVSRALSGQDTKDIDLQQSETYQFVRKIAEGLYKDCRELGYSRDFIEKACKGQYKAPTKVVSKKLSGSLVDFTKIEALASSIEAKAKDPFPFVVYEAIIKNSNTFESYIDLDRD